MTDIVQKLNRVAFLNDQRQAVSQERDALKEVIMAPVKEQLSDLEEEFSSRFESIDKELMDLYPEIETATLKQGETVQTDEYQAIFKKGRETWNPKLLEGYAKDHPAVLSCKVTGEPSVSISPRKTK
jgi:predicted  nucleic acid-binding Zn-ribbon protein